VDTGLVNSRRKHLNDSPRICMSENKYMPRDPYFVCEFGSAMTRNTVYRGCRVEKRDIDYLQVRECIPCMNECQGRNNG